MHLTLSIHPISEIAFGDHTALEGQRLEVSKQALTRLLLEDRRLESVDIEIVSPGESCRLGIVFDILEPRAKESGSGSDFPGILGPYAVAGQGETHVLRGAAVTVLDESAPVAAGKMLEMSGPPADATAFASLHHVVIAPHIIPDLPRRARLHALRGASVKAAVHLALAAESHEPDQREVFDLDGPTSAGRNTLPRVAYIAQIQSRQRVAEVDEQVLYGNNTAGMVPVPLHPNEWLDGALVCAYQNMQVETYFYQNHPVVLELHRRHAAGEINFVGTIATMAASDGDDRNRNCMMASQLAKWNLGADIVVLTKYGGGAPHADMAETARLCEALGMRTAVQVTDMSQDRRAESALLFNFPEVDAIVYCGGMDTKWSMPEPQRIVGGSTATAAALGEIREVAAANVCGATNQQGASRIRSFVY